MKYVEAARWVPLPRAPMCSVAAGDHGTRPHWALKRGRKRSDDSDHPPLALSRIPEAAGLGLSPHVYRQQAERVELSDGKPG